MLQPVDVLKIEQVNMIFSEDGTNFDIYNRISKY